MDLNWTPAKVAQLEQGWKAGLSAAKIAQQIEGVTRNAVIGKAYRLGLTLRVTPVDEVAERALPPKVATTAEKVWALEPNECRWPLGDSGTLDFHFCCDNRTAQSPYCRHHTYLARASRRKEDG